jgi:hypothetical protein
MHKFAIAFLTMLPVDGLVNTPRMLFHSTLSLSTRSIGSYSALASFGNSKLALVARQGTSSHRGRARPLSCAASSQESNEYGFSTFVSGPLYDGPPGCPKVTLFTKEECTLCDKVKAVLEQTRSARPHALYSVDIADPRNQVWWDRYKYDIPVLHIGGRFWIKHRITSEEALAGLAEAAAGTFQARQGDPDAKKMERSK